jgi:hypothetical protein
MNSHEIVERAITFDCPSRLPMKFDVVGVNDCYDVWTHDPSGWSFEQGGPDEWGCVWQQTAVRNTGQVVGHPLRDLAAMKDYAWPDPNDPRRYEGFDKQLAGADEKFVMFCFGSGIFERLHMLHGMTETLTDFYRRPAEMHELIERILDHHIRILRNCVRIADRIDLRAGEDARADVGATSPHPHVPASPHAHVPSRRIHAAAMADDWGLQDRAFLSVKLFREFFKPRYRRWFDEIRAAGAHPWLHSCGKVNEIVEEMIDCGLKVVNLQQPNTVGIDDISRRYKGRICFESLVDIQSTLPRGTLEDIHAEARALLDRWSTPAGGFIASDYNDAEAIGVTLERRLAMFEAFAEKGGYPGYGEIVARVREENAGGLGHSWSRQTVH